MSGRFVKGQSGNPGGRPKTRRPNNSAFDVIFDKRLTVTQDGVAREITVAEALEVQTYQAALKGSKLAVRASLKMIEKREKAIADRRRVSPLSKPRLDERDPENADEAMLLLGIAIPHPRCQNDPLTKARLALSTWATQAALSRPGRRLLSDEDVATINRLAAYPEQLKWPKGARK